MNEAEAFKEACKDWATKSAGKDLGEYFWQAALEWQRSQCEPVAWMVYTLDGQSVCVTDNPADFTDNHRALPLYTTPQAAQINEQMREALESAIDVAETLAKKLNIDDFWTHVSMLKEALAASTPK